MPYKEFETIDDANRCKMNITSVSCHVKKKLIATEIGKDFSNKEIKGLKDNIPSSSSSEQLLAAKDIKSNKNKFVSCKNTQQKKAKILRLEKKQNKLLAQGKTNTEIEAILSQPKQQQNCDKNLEQFFNELNSEMNKLEVQYYMSQIFSLQIYILLIHKFNRKMYLTVEITSSNVG